MAITAVQSPVAADTEAIIAQDGGTAARDEAVSLGGTQNRNNIGGEFSATGGSNITVNDPTVLSKALEALQTNNQKFSETIRDIAEDSRTGSSAVLDQALAKVSALAESKQTDGISSLGKLILWGIGIGVAGYALVTYFRTSK